jgi:hypothetical protein
MTQPKFHHWTEIFLEIRNHFHTSIHLSEFELSKRQCETSEVMRILNIRHVISR